MKKVLGRILLIIAILAVIAGIAFVSYGIYKKATLKVQNPVATIEIEDYGTIKVELYPDKAPNTVTNFIRLANRGFYNGSTIHRTVPNFVIQGGSKNGDTTASPKLSDIMDDVKEDKEYNINGEFIANGYNSNNLKHKRGVISMARADYSQYGSQIIEEGYNSASSQFYITVADNTSLDGLYAAFGEVIEGMDVVDKISNVEVYYRDSELKENEEAPKDDNGDTIQSDTPKKEIKIKSVTVETYGIDYGIPETHDVFDAYAWLLKQYYGITN